MVIRMGGSMLLKIAVFCSFLVTVLSLEKCCLFGFLYRDRSGKFKCVDIEGPSYINKKYVRLTLQPCYCPIIESKLRQFENNNCQNGYNCQDVLYDVESKLALNVRIAFSSEAKTKWTPLSNLKLPRTVVRRCCPEGKLSWKDLPVHKCVASRTPTSYKLDLFSQIPKETFSDSLQCPDDKETDIFPYNYTFIEEPFVNSPLRDHPLVQFLQKEAEPIVHCIQTGKSLAHVLAMCPREKDKYELLLSTLKTMENQFKIYACTDTNKFEGNRTVMKTMFASPLELGPLDKLLSASHDFGGYQRIIATIIKNGEKSQYWIKHETEFDCPKGIRQVINVTITSSGELIQNDTNLSLNDDRFCLSSVSGSDTFLDAYLCKGCASGLIISAFWISIAISFST